ncbi:hypothetical protein [Natronosalvus caseinilyticus]|uniref:hypothetical protein n=1 Tax=Natronosalvus caseinilyticus TaxID=2953747 RepID=UPI0028ACE17D|nr:hypothetical protein [Natronosalvus caseinilyticus]
MSSPIPTTRSDAPLERADGLRATAYAYRKPGPDTDWERLDDRGLPMGNRVVRTIFDECGGSIYAVNNAGCFVSQDFGDSCSVLETDWDGEESKTPRGLAVVS